MELIPVFSLIVLVATIGTFILAVAAYVMFRFKERRGQEPRPHFPAAFEAEVITPELHRGTTGPSPQRRGRYGGSILQTRRLHGTLRTTHHPNQRIVPEEKRRWG